MVYVKINFPLPRWLAATRLFRAGLEIIKLSGASVYRLADNGSWIRKGVQWGRGYISLGPTIEMASSSVSHRESREPLLNNMDDSIGYSTQNNVLPNGVEVDTDKASQIKENLQKYEQLFGTDEDAFDQPTTTRKELWSYYLYYNVRRSIKFEAHTDQDRVTMESVPGHTPRLSFNLP